MELEAEVQKLKDLNAELVRKQVTFIQTLILDMLNVLLQCILCKRGFMADILKWIVSACRAHFNCFAYFVHVVGIRVELKHSLSLVPVH